MQRDPRKPNRRYLVTPDWKPDYPGIPTNLAWLQTDPESRVQVQRQDSLGRLKISIHGIPVHEASLSVEETERLMAFAPLRLDKTRYLHSPAPHERQIDTGRWIIDVYGKELADENGPLMVARLEGQLPEHIPGIFTQDISEDPRYHGAWLARYGRPDPQLHAYLVTVPMTAEEVNCALHPAGTKSGDQLIARVEVQAQNEQQAALKANYLAMHSAVNWFKPDYPQSTVKVTRHTLT